MFHRDVSGVRIVRVNPVGIDLLGLDMADRIGDELVEMIPKLLFRQIFPAPAPDPADVELLAHLLDRQSVLRPNGRIVDPAGHQMHVLHFGPLRELTRQIHDVADLPAIVGVSSKFRIRGSKQSMKRQHH